MTEPIYRVTRTLTYEGPLLWLQATLNHGIKDEILIGPGRIYEQRSEPKLISEPEEAANED